MKTADPDDLESEYELEPDPELPRARRKGRSKKAPEENAPSPVRVTLLTWLARIFLVSAMLAVVIYLWTAVLVTRRPAQPIAIASVLTPTRTITLVPTPTATRTPILSVNPNWPLVGIVAGHSGNDSGASCPDGMREVDVTTDVATRVRGLLATRGYRVDVLDEFDARLSKTRRDYAPRAFLAIHADSCVYYASGYKVARAQNSGSPDEDDRLVRCVTSSYAAATQLPFHAGSITTDMTQYHGLSEIDSRTPGAIIELGFLGSQHDLLKSRRDIVATGVATGLDKFMQGQTCPLATDPK